MQQTLMILSETEEINSLLYKPIIATQRIKYTCFNVSTNNIVLGSSSGSLYLFTREPCTFQQLMPLSQGPVFCVAISPDEKTIALATKRGSVCLVAVRPTVKLLSVSGEHIGQSVTTICWNSNSSEIYVGDTVGNVSTTGLSTFTVNGIFQPQSCALMNLDSTIVQMNFSSKLLLISTMTRCYICDTSNEQYKQIGKKARNGDYGACFLNEKFERDGNCLSSSKTDEKIFSRKGLFNFIPNSKTEIKDDRGPKIYCARPGYRLWEVTSTGTVVKTHNFGKAFATSPSNVYRLNSTRESVNRHNDRPSIKSASPFHHLHSLCEKYLFTHTMDSICVIDPTNASVVLLNDEYIGIACARTINEKIYLMTDSGIFHCLTLSTPEALILDLYEKKCYDDCLRACKNLRPELIATIVVDEKSVEKSLTMNTDNSKNFDTNDKTSILESVVTLIQSNMNVKPIKLNSGIVVVNTGNGKNRDEDYFNDHQICEDSTIDVDLKNCEIPMNYDNDDCFVTDNDRTIFVDGIAKNMGKRIGSEVNESSIVVDDTTIATSNDADRHTDLDEKSNSPTPMEIIFEPVRIMIDKLKSSVITHPGMEKRMIGIEDKLRDINVQYSTTKNDDQCFLECLNDSWNYYHRILLDNTKPEFLNKIGNDRVIDRIFRAFTSVNKSLYQQKSCCRSYSRIRLVEPKYREIGSSLLERFVVDDQNHRCDELCENVPFFWREYSSMCADRRLHLDVLSIRLIGLNDDVALATILTSLNDEQWDNFVERLRESSDGTTCDNCGTSNAIDWNGICREIVKRDGPSAGLEFLVRVDKKISDLSVDRSLFESLIFTKILEHRGLNHTVEFDRNRLGSNEYEAMCSPKVKDQLVETLEKDLGRKIDEDVFGTGSHHWGIRFRSKSSTCPCCTLPLQTPILLGNNGISLFPCGHAYHVSCLIQKKLTRCNLHT